jgi:hypothetical protein
MTAVHAYAGNPSRQVSGETAAPRRSGGSDFSSMIDELAGKQPPRAGAGKGGQSSGSTGTGGNGSEGIEPFRITDSKVPNGTEPGTLPDVPHIDPGTLPAVTHLDPPDGTQGIEPAKRKNGSVAHGSTGTAGGTGGTEPHRFNPTTAVAESSKIAEGAVTAMSDVLMRFTSMNALLRLGQSS